MKNPFRNLFCHCEHFHRKCAAIHGAADKDGLLRRKALRNGLWQCRRGVAATEFAVALPFLLVLMLGGIEISRYVIIHQKLEKVAYTIADVVSQSDTITTAQLNQAVIAAATIMEPYDFSPDGVVFISSVYKSGSNAPTVRWQYSGGGALSASSQIGAVGAVAAMPNGLVLNPSDNVIISEVFYRYQPFLTGGVFADDEDLYKVTIFKPRLGALTTPPA
ncbi:MAG: TadE/TadG family type IV pilus assembly protein [Alphaproteobacteria bacterium]|nr:TadE/TadG family type IV pilus assembly protein [Alphaproteobacteria bacterium]